MKKSGLYVVARALAFTVSGCFSLSWAHNRRHVRKSIDELTADLDRWEDNHS